MQTAPAAEAPEIANQFRQIWRGFGSAVALIATELDGQRHSMVATAATSVSMDPPSLLICVNRNASSYAALKARGAFSLGLLPSTHHSIGGAIARASSAERFQIGTWRTHTAAGATNNLPWLEESAASLFCVTDQAMDYGTHTIFVARVVDLCGVMNPDPLLYCDGRYGRFEGLL